MSDLTGSEIAERERRTLSPWLTSKEAAARLRVSLDTVYAEVAAGRLRAARIGGRRNLRFLAEWCDAYLEATARVVDVVPRRRFQR